MLPRINYKLEPGVCAMTQQVESPAAKPDGLSSIPRAHMVEDTHSHKSFSDLTHALVVSALSHTHTK